MISSSPFSDKKIEYNSVFGFLFRYWAYRSSEMETIGNSNLDSQHLTIQCQPKINLINYQPSETIKKQACQIINQKVFSFSFKAINERISIVINFLT